MSRGTGIMESQSIGALFRDQTLVFNSLRGAGWCLAAGFLVAGSLPFIESTFGVVTNISLLEMGDISHPLLQELVRRARRERTTTRLPSPQSPKRLQIKSERTACYAGSGPIFMTSGRC